MLQLTKFEQAHAILKPILRDTPLFYSEYFSAQSENDVFIKPENLQVTGSYKIRGSYYKINSMSEEQYKKGIITSSAGNHAQGVAYAARLKKAKATIVMPVGTPLVKINNTKKFGAEVVLSGDVYDEAYATALELAEKHGYEFVHPFNDFDIATGQGTIAFEILNNLPDTDYIILPIGGGGLAAGVATLAKMLRPEITIIGVEPAGAACMLSSINKKQVTSLKTVATIADGVAVKTPGDKIFPYVQKNVDAIITVDDTDIPNALLDLMENHKMLAENAGLLSLAALKQLDSKGKKVVCLLSGGNMDVIAMPSLVQHGLVSRSRIFTFSVQLPDKPGELLKIVSIIAEEKGNVIQLKHNQFININRSVAVELRVTLETFGYEHKMRILQKIASLCPLVEEVEVTNLG